MKHPNVVYEHLMISGPTDLAESQGKIFLPFAFRMRWEVVFFGNHVMVEQLNLPTQPLAIKEISIYHAHAMFLMVTVFIK